MAEKAVEKEIKVYENNFGKIKVPKSIKNMDEFQNIAKSFASAKATIKEIDDKKISVTKPLNEALSKYRDLFKPAEKVLSALKGDAQKVLTDYVNKVEGKNIAKIASIQERLESGELSPDKALAMLQKYDTVTTSVVGVTISAYTEVVVVDPAKVPAKYHMIDLAAIKKDALGNKSKGIKGMEIPGVEIRVSKRVI